MTAKERLDSPIKLRADGMKNFGGVVREAPRRNPAGRVCKQPGCDVVLSVYNRSMTCYQHKGFTW